MDLRLHTNMVHQHDWYPQPPGGAIRRGKSYHQWGWDEEEESLNFMVSNPEEVEHLLLRLRDFLGEQGWEPDAAILLAEALKRCGYHLAPDQLDLPQGWAREAPAPTAPENEAQEDAQPLDPVEVPPEEVVEPWGT